MAGMSVTVCLPPGAVRDVRAALTRALAPFDMNGDDTPYERGMWDSWRIRGGNNGNGFAVAAGHEADPRLVHDDPGPDGEPRPSPPGVCAGGPRALLDFDFSRPNLAYERAVGASWDLWQRLSATYPPAVPLAELVGRRRDGEAFTGDDGAERMLAAYHAQPLVRAFLDHPLSLALGYPHFPVLSEHPVMHCRSGRAACIAELTPSRPPNTDVLTVDGWWIESDGSAVHAFCDPEHCPHEWSRPAGWSGSEPYLAALPGDVVVVRVHGHC